MQSLMMNQTDDIFLNYDFGSQLHEFLDPELLQILDNYDFDEN